MKKKPRRPTSSQRGEVFSEKRRSVVWTEMETECDIDFLFKGWPTLCTEKTAPKFTFFFVLRSKGTVARGAENLHIYKF